MSDNETPASLDADTAADLRRMAAKWYWAKQMKGWPGPLYRGLEAGADALDRADAAEKALAKATLNPPSFNVDTELALAKAEARNAELEIGIIDLVQDRITNKFFDLGFHVARLRELVPALARRDAARNATKEPQP